VVFEFGMFCLGLVICPPVAHGLSVWAEFVGSSSRVHQVVSMSHFDPLSFGFSVGRDMSDRPPGGVGCPRGADCPMCLPGLSDFPRCGTGGSVAYNGLSVVQGRTVRQAHGLSARLMDCLPWGC
jgi:hypothetical protein